eukprot:3254617-Alexandrium_andersonii.AAC.1
MLFRLCFLSPERSAPEPRRTGSGWSPERLGEHPDCPPENSREHRRTSKSSGELSEGSGELQRAPGNSSESNGEFWRVPDSSGELQRAPESFRELQRVPDGSRELRRASE